MMKTAALHSTAAALAVWLSPPSDGRALTLSELKSQHTAIPLTSLVSDVAIAELLQPAAGYEAFLLVFSTAPHKFAVLCCGQQSVLLHSNQDDTRGGRRFTLLKWLAAPIARWTPAQLSFFIRRLAAATTGAADHSVVFAQYFGRCQFVRGNASDYWPVVPWVVKLPISVHAVA